MYPQRYPHLSAQLLAHQGHTLSFRMTEADLLDEWSEVGSCFYRVRRKFLHVIALRYQVRLPKKLQ